MATTRKKTRRACTGKRKAKKRTGGSFIIKTRAEKKGRKIKK